MCSLSALPYIVRLSTTTTTTTKSSSFEFVSSLNTKLKQQLQKYLHEYESIQRKLSEEASKLNPKEIVQLSKQSAYLSPLVETFKQYEATYHVLYFIVSLSHSWFLFQKQIPHFFELEEPN
jgi:uncharacterized UPF0160 family protein